MDFIYDGVSYKDMHVVGDDCRGCAFQDQTGNGCDASNEYKNCGVHSIIWIKDESKVPAPEPVTLATNKQEGGLHYKTAIQPIEYIHANKLDFFEGNVVKYVTRHRNKNKAEDIKKAIHYLQLILQLEYNQGT